MNQFIKYVGLDTHKETIAVAIADSAGGKPRYYGEIVNTSKALTKLIKDVSPNGEVVSFCYEAGPCGYVFLSERLPSTLKIWSLYASTLLPYTNALFYGSRFFRVRSVDLYNVLGSD